MGSDGHVLDSSLIDGLSLFLLGFLAGSYRDRGFLVGNSLEDMHHLLQFGVLAHLSLVLVLILDVQLLGLRAGTQLHLHHAVFGRIDVAVVLAVPIMEVKTGDGLVLIGKQ